MDVRKYRVQLNKGKKYQAAIGRAYEHRQLGVATNRKPPYGRSNTATLARTRTG